ncbi:hypothetical protein RUND412_005560 [Rhizina undulata]
MPKYNRSPPLELSKPLPSSPVSTFHAHDTLHTPITIPIVSDFPRYADTEIYEVRPQQEIDPTDVSDLFRTASSSSSSSTSSIDLSARIINAQEIQEIEFYHGRKRKNKGKARQINIPEPYGSKEASINTESHRDVDRRDFVTNKDELAYPRLMTPGISRRIEDVLKTPSPEPSPDPSREFTSSISTLNAALIGPFSPQPMHAPIGSGRPGMSGPSVINSQPLACRPSYKVQTVLGIGMEYPILPPGHQQSTSPARRNSKKFRLSPIFSKLPTQSSRLSTKSEIAVKGSTWLNSKEETERILARFSLKDRNDIPEVGRTDDFHSLKGHDVPEVGRTDDFPPWEPLRISRKNSIPEVIVSTESSAPPVSTAPYLSLNRQPFYRPSSSIYEDDEEDDDVLIECPGENKVEELEFQFKLVSHPQYIQSSVNFPTTFNEDNLLPASSAILRSPSAPNIILSTPDDVTKFQATVGNFEAVISDLPPNEDDIFNVTPTSSISEEMYNTSSGEYGFYRPHLAVQTSWYEHDQNVLATVNKQRKEELDHFSEILDPVSLSAKNFSQIYDADVEVLPEIIPPPPEKIFRPNSRWSDYSGDDEDEPNWRSSVMAHIRGSRLDIRKPLSMAKKNFKKMTSSPSLNNRSSSSSAEQSRAVRSSAESSSLAAEVSRTASGFSSIAAKTMSGSPKRDLPVDKRFSDVSSLQSPIAERKKSAFVEAFGLVSGRGGEKKAEKRREELKKKIRIVAPGSNGVGGPGKGDWI